MNLIKSIPRNRILIEKLTVAQLLEKFPTVLEPVGLFSYSHEPTIGRYCSLNKYIKNLLSYFLKNHLILSSHLHLDILRNLFPL
jgi:hypothetical protein